MPAGRKPSTTLPAPSPMAKVPAPPASLSKEGKAEWRRMAPILVLERRTLDVGDLPTFLAYCVAVGMAADARATIAAQGMFYEGASGPKRHPAVAVLSDAMTQIRLLAGELGLTPVSRSRAPMRAAEVGDDEAAEFL